ncbi:hypothetical protein GCM10023216_23420 [Isoptericola chiayiensis]|uniref:Transposase n=1 Tax=Isoptericola chiayiensis TaxID=579446 RepID=A0ABP8YK74_9MICO|nr:hypothetical protein [Isoptericola chiayiensis]NOW00569.1 hypothetical protein [Isoptericola chiayiensis]
MALPDWRHRSEHIRTRTDRYGPGEQNIEPAWANEAYADPYAVEFRPDFASTSGQSVRTIGWSDTAGFLITVITVEDSENLWGATAWKSDTGDQRRYTGEDGKE